jgi:apolipoprotein D and lipocalin family protein
MKTLFIIILIFSFSYSSAPNKISYVDPKSFSGLWYEIARTYNSFEENCVASTVEYILKESNQYKVFNRCFENKIGGNLVQYSGKAVALDKNSMSRLKKTYFWIFSQEYKVIYLNDYKSAVIADDDMEYVWVMSRTPKMSKKEFSQIISLLDNYMNTNDLIITPQDEKGKFK